MITDGGLGLAMCAERPLSLMPVGWGAAHSIACASILRTGVGLAPAPVLRPAIKLSWDTGTGGLG
jgi:hypothetical protein